MRPDIHVVYCGVTRCRYSGVHRETGQRVAVKLCIRKATSDVKEQLQLKEKRENEGKVLARLAGVKGACGSGMRRKRRDSYS